MAERAEPLHSVSVTIPLGAVLWQARCSQCGANYAVMHHEQDNAPHPRFCVFCMARAVFYRVDQGADT